MNKLPQQTIIVLKDRKKLLDTMRLVNASIASMGHYNEEYDYTPKEREPFDALADRFMRCVEMSLRFMRSYERYLYAENSDTLRDLLNRMEKLHLISSVETWLRMRDIRNRIVHDYLPHDLKLMYDDIQGTMGAELQAFSEKVVRLELQGE